jgi:hypothetical protein
LDNGSFGWIAPAAQDSPRRERPFEVDNLCLAHNGPGI